jgi:hypothetical protein
MAGAIAIVLISAFFSIWLLSRKRQAAEEAAGMIFPDAMPANGVEIPLLDAYAGIKALAPITFTHNGIGPKLVLYEDRLDYKVFVSRSALFSEIEGLLAYRGRFFNRLLFKFTNSNLFFMAVLPDEKILERILRFFEAKGIYPDEKSRL